MRHDQLDTPEESEHFLKHDSSAASLADLPDLDGPSTTIEPESPPPGTPPIKNEAYDPKAPVSWRDLPRKRQLGVITLARMSEPLVQTSLQSYMFYQLRSFSPELPSSTIAAQAGILHASFTAAQFLTAMLWGRIADSPRAGRKTVLLIGLFGTAISCLGFGLSRSFAMALAFRTLGGATNGNVGVMRTMISEIVRQKRFQSRAFLLLPMTFNIGVIVGPIMGGVLSDPAASYPSVFGTKGFFVDFPYALPNIVSAVFLTAAALSVWLGLEETLDALRDHPDMGTRLRRWLVARLWKNSSGHSRDISYSSVASEDVELSRQAPKKHGRPRYTQRLPFRRIFTRNVALTFVAHFLQAIHVGTFNSLWFVFLSTPVYDPASPSAPARHLPFHFTGGVGLAPRSVGMAMAILGVIGITLQLFLYPRLSARLGTVRALRFALCCFPIAYCLVPFLAVVPSSTPPPSAKTGALIWMALCCVLFVQVLGRTFALPSQTILVNNCSPHPSVLGTIHGLGQSVSSFGRTVGPIAGGVIFGYGLDRGMVGLAYWILAVVAICNFMASLLLRDGDGHEIWLEGDEEDEPIDGMTREGRA